MQKLKGKELYELKKKQKEDAKQTDQRKEILAEAPKKISKYFLYGLIVFGIIGGLGWYVTKQPKASPGDIISRSGIHWHPELSISINGQKQKVSANIGIGARHQPIHTHDTSGVLHLEIRGLVTKDDTKLGRFFKIWGKQFNSNCIFDSCNGESGIIKMLVNSKENKEFENYQMKDGDKIEILYE